MVSARGFVARASLQTPLSIAFAYVATHNHFVLDRGGKVFKQSAPVIKLPVDATEDDHLQLLGLLNSSRRLLLDEAGLPRQGKRRGWRRHCESSHGNAFRQFDGTKLKQFPVS